MDLLQSYRHKLNGLVLLNFLNSCVVCISTLHDGLQLLVVLVGDPEHDTEYGEGILRALSLRDRGADVPRVLGVEVDQVDLHGVGLAADGVLGPVAVRRAPVHMELGEREQAGEAAAANLKSYVH